MQDLSLDNARIGNHLLRLTVRLLCRGGHHCTRRSHLALVMQCVLRVVVLWLLRVVLRYAIVVRLGVVRHHAGRLVVGTHAIQLLGRDRDAAIVANLVHTHGRHVALHLRVLHRLLLLLL